MAARETQLRRPDHRCRRRRAARGHRGARAGPARRDHLQVAVRQGAHRHGRGRLRGVDGQRQQQRQLAGALPRHDARRQVPQQLADGRAARQGVAGPRLGARDLRRAVRPHAGRQDQPAQLRRPRVPAPRARRRPHRARDDPHDATEDRVAAAGRRQGEGPARRGRRAAQGLRRGDAHRAAHRRERRDRRRVRLLPRDRRVRPVQGAGRRAGHWRHRQGRQGHHQLLGVAPATAWASRCGQARRC